MGLFKRKHQKLRRKTAWISSAMGLVLALSACGGPPQNAATGDSTIIASTYATTDPNFPTTSPPSTGSPTASPTSAGAPAENRNGTAICESIDASALTAALGETYKFTEFGAADANYVGCFANVTSGSLPTDPHVTAVTFSTLKLLGSTDLAVRSPGHPTTGLGQVGPFTRKSTNQQNTSISDSRIQPGVPARSAEWLTTGPKTQTRQLKRLLISLTVWHFWYKVASSDSSRARNSTGSAAARTHVRPTTKRTMGI